MRTSFFATGLLGASRSASRLLSRAADNTIERAAERGCTRSVVLGVLSALALSTGLTHAETTYEYRAPVQSLTVATLGMPVLSAPSLVFTAPNEGGWGQPLTVVLRNEGSLPFTIAGWGIQGGDGSGGFYVLDSTCEGSLEPQESCEATVNAQMQDGPRTGHLLLDTRNSTVRIQRLQLLSAPLSAGEPSAEEENPQEPVAPSPPTPWAGQLSSTHLNFGSVVLGNEATLQVLVSNPSSEPARLASLPLLQGDGAYSASTTCTLTLASADSCAVEVRFAPTQPQTAFATLSFEPLNGSMQTVSIQGQGVAPLSLASAALSSANVGQAYTFDFKTLLAVGGSFSADKSGTVWSVNGALPQNLVLNASTGVLSGTTGNAHAGGVLTVTATRGGYSAQQSYLIAVNGLFMELNQLALGTYSSCGRSVSGGAFCWGPSNAGQLGIGTVAENQPRPVAVSGLSSGVAHVSNAHEAACAVTTAGALRCWGSNATGRLGDGTTTTRTTPVAVSGLSSGVSKVAISGTHTCALLSTGAVRCWGSNDRGQLGDGTKTNRLTPVAVSGLSSGVVDIAVTTQGSCALTSLGAVRCWGSSALNGQGTGLDVLTPTTVSELSSGVLRITAGGSHWCAVTTTNQLYCWGGNTYGQLGTGDKLAQAKPVLATVLGAVAQVNGGSHHTCAVNTAGRVFCWGHNVLGQLGDGGSVDSLSAVAVAGLPSTVVEISAGHSHACARLSNAQTLCWGRNSFGQLGNGQTASISLPVAVLR